MATNAWKSAPKPEQHVEPAHQIMFSPLGGWSPAQERSMTDDCPLCLNGSKLCQGTVCGSCLRSDPETDAEIARILVIEGLPKPETPASMKKWLALSPDEQYPARRPIFLTKFTPSDN